MTIGSRIAQARKAKCMTQEALAEAMGVTRQAVSKWETDQSAPDMKHLLALSVTLDTEVEYLAVGTREEPPKKPVIRYLSYGFGILGVVLYLIGVFTGSLNQMVMIPIHEGFRMGIPMLYYGKDPGAVILLLASVFSCFSAVILRIISHVTE